jgi:NAD(P)-dependent dehydrogenase (short-subunit alcohol dehydrogenase family)
MPNISITKSVAGIGLATAAALAVAIAGAGVASADRGDDGKREDARTPVSVEVLTPQKGDNAGQTGKGWLVNLAVRYPGGVKGLKAAGYQGPQLTGPATHNNTAPFPGTFSPGRDDRLPGLVVLLSTTSSLSGPGTNLANLFNVTGVTNRTARVTEITDSWIVGAPNFGVDTNSVLMVAVVDDLDHNGVFDDAPAVVPDSNHDGQIDANDLTALGLASRVETVAFHINGDA